MNHRQLAAMWMRRQGTYSYAKKLKFKHGSDPDKLFNASQLKRGIKVETEHTNDLLIAKQIAKAHLAEDAKYYTKLDRMERGYCYAMGNAMWITKDGQRIDISEDETPSGKNEHMGFLMASYDPKFARKIGLSTKEMRFLQNYYRRGESKAMMDKLVDKVFTANTRVRVVGNQIAVQGPKFDKPVKETVQDIALAKGLKNPEVVFETSPTKRWKKVELFNYSKMPESLALRRAGYFITNAESQLPPPSWKPSKFVAAYVDGERSWRQEFDRKPPRPRVSAWKSIKPKS